MSVEISWIVVGATADDTLTHLDLEDTGQPVTEGACEFAAAQLPHGGTLVVMNTFWHPWIHPDVLLEWSKRTRVLGCSSSERTNTSTAFLYRAGEQVWQVSHLLDEGDDHLDVVGIAPRERHALLANATALRAETGGDTVFDVPAQLAALLCGYRHGRAQEVGLTRLRRRSGFTRARHAVRGWVGRNAAPLPAPNDRDDLRAWLMEAIGSTLAPLGFQREPVPHGGFHWVRDDARVALGVSIGTYGFPPSITSDAFVYVRHHDVHRILAIAAPRRPADRETAAVAISTLEGRRAFMIESQLDVQQYVAFLARTLPPLLAQCGHLPTLVRLNNQGRREMGQVDTLDPELSLVLAWLTGNPHFDAMLDEADAMLRKTPDDPVGLFRRLADDLRRRGPPGAMGEAPSHG